METYKTVLGTYTGNHIDTGEELVPARAYSSMNNQWKNRYGFWQIKMIDGWLFGVVCNYVEFFSE